MLLTKVNAPASMVDFIIIDEQPKERTSLSTPQLMGLRFIFEENNVIVNFVKEVFLACDYIHFF